MLPLYRAATAKQQPAETRSSASTVLLLSDLSRLVQ
jgi:hypothetical protein